MTSRESSLLKRNYELCLNFATASTVAQPSITMRNLVDLLYEYSVKYQQLPHFHRVHKHWKSSKTTPKVEGKEILETDNVELTFETTNPTEVNSEVVDTINASKFISSSSQISSVCGPSGSQLTTTENSSVACQPSSPLSTSPSVEPVITNKSPKTVAINGTDVLSQPNCIHSATSHTQGASIASLKKQTPDSIKKPRSSKAKRKLKIPLMVVEDSTEDINEVTIIEETIKVPDAVKRLLS